MSGSASDPNNLLRAYANWHAPIQIPLAHPAQQMQVPQGPLPGQGLFANMTPAQQFWFQHLMGQGVGAPAPGGNVDPYWMMMMLQGPQAAMETGAEENE